MSYYCELGIDRKWYQCEDAFDKRGYSMGGMQLCDKGSDIYIGEDGIKVIACECIHLKECDICDKAKCKSYKLDYHMSVKGPGGGYLDCSAPNYCPNCGRYIGIRV